VIPRVSSRNLWCSYLPCILCFIFIDPAEAAVAAKVAAEDEARKKTEFDKAERIRMEDQEV
jgi:hypothetical protein